MQSYILVGWRLPLMPCPGKCGEETEGRQGRTLPLQKSQARHPRDSMASSRKKAGRNWCARVSHFTWWSWRGRRARHQLETWSVLGRRQAEGFGTQCFIWVLDTPPRTYVAWCPGWQSWDVVEPLGSGARREVLRSLGACP